MLKRSEWIVHEETMEVCGLGVLCPQCEELVDERHNLWIVVPVALVFFGLILWIAFQVF